MSTAGERDRVLYGMRPTGRLHLGHYHGVLKNWARLQNEYDSFFFVADWHALIFEFVKLFSPVGACAGPAFEGP